ncbi:hypothetical protein [Yersinia intermedia]|uniref:hypothetical protein n=1 Tax=Yersinia intermedia TaxID=631 RepID=UPI0030D0260F
MHHFLFSFQLWEATSSISVMKMLAEQTEKNVTLAVKEADEPGAITKGEYEDEAEDQFGEYFSFQRIYYTCGSCIGDDREEVRSEYIRLITQLTRRSAFLTIFGLFEHRISECLQFMINLSDYKEGISGKGVIEKTHTILKKVFEGKLILDVDHLTVIRNIMIHNDGVAKNYNKLLNLKSKKTHAEKRLLNAVRRTEGITINDFDGVLMNSNFLMYAVGEFERYVKSLETVVKTYHCKVRVGCCNESS